ncbi:hypothetical protein LPUS_08877 [Lasallia pustulata]|uniref:Uncharacterized protein n=1 Tax=Lasallia pustulata TaxID=136370 RepID=A0A1W5D680_9LECA|nr:hypothetical protein LPUS_08877 [Lasallia pustulata]
MSGLELLAVVGCVAAVVSAYKDGSSLVKELMEKRRKKKALKDAQSQADLSTQGLEQSLTRGSVVVQGRYDHEFQSLGPQEGLQFANGDRECMDALKNIIIHLQSQVILNLRHAWSEDTFVDFSALQDVSDTSQKQAVLALLQLHQRILIAAPIRHISTKPPSPSPSYGFLAPPTTHRGSSPLSRQTTPQGTPFGRPSRQMTGDTLVEHEMPQHATFDETGFGPFAATTATGFSTRPRPKDSSRLGKVSEDPKYPEYAPPASTIHEPQNARTAEESETRGELVNEPLAHDAYSIHSVSTLEPDEDPRGRPPSATSTSIPDQDSVEWNPWRTSLISLKRSKPCQKPRNTFFGRNNSAPQEEISTSVFDIPSPQLATRMPELARHNIPMTNRDLATANLQVRSAPPIFAKTRGASAPIISTNPKPFLPSDANNFGGFCKGAWRLQIGDRKKAMDDRQRPGGMYNNSAYWKCTKCDFEGRMVKDVTGKKSTDSRVALSDDIQYRWEFLFKSHVATKGGGSPMASSYGCVFCCAEGRGTPIFGGIPSLMAHIQEHRERPPSGEIVFRMNCIIGRQARLDEEFDITLPARVAELS